jgi:mercuric ion transport protein
MEKKSTIAILLSLVPSFLVSTCCLGPLIFILTGVSIGWLSGFTKISPYKPYLMGVAILILSYPFYQLYIKKNPIECDCDVDPAKVRMKKINKVLFWTSIAILFIAIIYPYILTSFL